MKKFLCILLTAILLLALTSCSFNLPQFHSSKSEHDTPTTDSTENVTQNISLIYDFSDGLAIFKTDNGYGYLDEKGNIVIAPLFEYAENFNTIAKVKRTDNSNYEYINKSGKTVYSFTGKEISVGDFSNGYFWVETKSETVAGNIHTMTYYDML